jgi:hypothetical protein
MPLSSGKFRVILIPDEMFVSPALAALSLASKNLPVFLHLEDSPYATGA